MNLEFIKPQNLGSLLIKSSQSNFDLRLPGSYIVRSYLITTVYRVKRSGGKNVLLNYAVALIGIEMQFHKSFDHIVQYPHKSLNTKVCHGTLYGVSDFPVHKSFLVS